MSMKDRKDAFENKFAHDADLRFKAEARRNRLLAQWVAGQIGRDDVDAYVKEVVISDLDEAGDDDVVRKVMADFEVAGVAMAEADLRAKMSELLAEAVAQVQGE